MKIGEVEKRLKMLVKLCYETEPTLDDLKKIQHDTPEVTELFRLDRCIISLEMVTTIVHLR